MMKNYAGGDTVKFCKSLSLFSDEKCESGSFKQSWFC